MPRSLGPEFRRLVGAPHRAADPGRRAAHRAGEGEPGIAEAEDEDADARHPAFRFDGGASGVIGRPASGSAISVASRFSRVSAFTALITHHTAG